MRAKDAYVALAASVFFVAETSAYADDQLVATHQAAPSEVGEVVVVGVAKPLRFTSRQMTSALREFARQRATYAPSARLYFQVISRTGQSLGPLRLYLRSGDEVVEVPLDAEGRFSIPSDISADATLVTNQSRSRVAISPLVMSPGSSASQRLLGDLRIQCRVNWAMIGAGASVVVRTMFSAAGGCGGTKFAYYATANRPITNAVAINGTVRKNVSIWHEDRFLVPVGDRELDNWTSIRLTFP